MSWLRDVWVDPMMESSGRELFIIVSKRLVGLELTLLDALHISAST